MPGTGWSVSYPFRVSCTATRSLDSSLGTYLVSRLEHFRGGERWAEAD